MKLALFISHAVIPILITMVICAIPAASVEKDEELVKIGQSLHKDSNDFDPKQLCAWDDLTKTCGMSLSAISRFYDKLPQEVLDSAYSLQDCSPITTKGDCNGKFRSGCHWTSDGICESLLFSGLDLSSSCYGAAQNIFYRNCGVSEARSGPDNCQNTDKRAGCVWTDGNFFDPCFFNTTNFIEDLDTIAKRPKKELPSVIFSTKSKKMAVNLEKKCSIPDKASCRKQADCTYVDVDGCTPKIPAIMMLANITRHERSELECSLVDLVRIGKCALRLTEQDCQGLVPDCFWDGMIGACLPGPINVFKEAAKGETKLVAELDRASNTCRKIKTRRECDP